MPRGGPAGLDDAFGTDGSAALGGSLQGRRRRPAEGKKRAEEGTRGTKKGTTPYWEVPHRKSKLNCWGSEVQVLGDLRKTPGKLQPTNVAIGTKRRGAHAPQRDRSRRGRHPKFAAPRRPISAATARATAYGVVEGTIVRFREAETS